MGASLVNGWKILPIVPKERPWQKSIQSQTFVLAASAMIVQIFKTKTCHLLSVLGFVIDVGISVPAADYCATYRDILIDGNPGSAAVFFLRLHPLELEVVPRVLQRKDLEAYGSPKLSTKEPH